MRTLKDTSITITEKNNILNKMVRIIIDLEFFTARTARIVANMEFAIAKTLECLNRREEIFYEIEQNLREKEQTIAAMEKIIHIYGK